MMYVLLLVECILKYFHQYTVLLRVRVISGVNAIISILHDVMTCVRVLS
jgi:hypothetical protein